MKSCFFYQTKIGRIGIEAEDDALVHIYFENQKPDEETEIVETQLIFDAYLQIKEYLNGRRQVFELPLKSSGTPFQEKAWRALQEIPYGETRSYLQQAQMLGDSKAVRAVGGANHRNPLPLVIPCHRVIGANGSLTGFGGGLEIKQRLLEIEQEGLKK